MNRPLPGKQLNNNCLPQGEAYPYSGCLYTVTAQKTNQSSDQASQIRVKYFFNALFQDRYCFCLR